MIQRVLEIRPPSFVVRWPELSGPVSRLWQQHVLHSSQAVSPGGWGQVQGGFFLLCRKQVSAETHYWMAAVTLQLRSVLGDADVLILRKTVSVPCRLCRVRRGQPGVSHCYWNCSYAPRDYILTHPGWENAQGEGVTWKPEKGQGKPAVRDSRFSFCRWKYAFTGSFVIRN